MEDGMDAQASGTEPPPENISPFMESMMVG